MDWTVSIFLGSVAVSAVLLVRTWVRNRSLRRGISEEQGPTSPGANVWDRPGARQGSEDSGGEGQGD